MAEESNQLGGSGIKTTVAGRKPQEAKEDMILNWVVRVKDGGWEYEADQRRTRGTGN